jgi:hypothetical protein
MAVTTEKFIESVERLTTMPSNQVLYKASSDFLEMIYEKINDTLIPIMDNLKQDFFVATPIDIPLETGKSLYRFPSRSYGRKVREIKLISSDGNTVANFPLIPVERDHLYQASSMPFGFRFQGDRIEIVGSADPAYSIRVWFFLGPSKPVLAASAGIIQSIAGDDVTLTQTAPATFMANTLVDFIDKDGMSQCIAIDQEITNVAGNTISFAAGTVPADLRAGDYLALVGESPVLQLPQTCIPYLRTLVAHEALFGISDYEAMGRLEKIMEKEEKRLLSFHANRSDGEPTILINMHGFARRGRGFRGIGIGRGY